MEAAEVSLQVKELRDEIRTLQSEIHLLKRQQSSRRGEPGLKGDPGKDSVVPGPQGPAGVVSKAQAIAMFREVVNEPETLRQLVKEAVKVAVSEFARRLKRTDAEGEADRVRAERDPDYWYSKV